MDENRAHGAHPHQFAIKLHVTAAFKDQIDLCQFLMIMGPGITANVHEVDGGRSVNGLGKGAAGLAARAFNGINFRE